MMTLHLDYIQEVLVLMYFSRVKLLMKGTLIHDITDYNRIAKMFSTLQLHDKRLNHGDMGSGTRVEYFESWSDHLSDTTRSSPPSDNAMTVCFSFDLGTFTKG